jgi:hypothetical protein
MGISSHNTYQRSLSKKLTSWLKRHSRPLNPLWLEAALMLLRLDLDRFSPDLELLYSASARGLPRFDPCCLLRSLLLMTLLGFTSIDKFAKELRRCPRLAQIAGFPPHKTPSVGAFYAFLDRLEDGPFQPSCPHRIRPSRLRKGRHRRNLSVEREEKESRRKQILLNCNSITQHLKQQLLQSPSLARPLDLQSRLEDLLVKVGIKPSAQRGLLGELSRVIVAGDGSSLVTGASSVGKPSCNCRKEGRYNCKCDRFYSDPTADWGYDSYRDCYYFGHTFYQLVVSSNGHDLPLHLTIGPASESDFTLSLKSLDRLEKALSDNRLDLKIEAVALDSGHDGLGVYEYLKAKQIKAVIALNQRNGHARPTGTPERITDLGTPLCPAGLEMRRHAKASNGRIYYNCPVKRPTHILGKTDWKSYLEECPRGVLCQPETKMGPVVYVRSDQDPRLYPEIRRDSPLSKKIMYLRTGCERSNSTKKVTYKLGQRPCRNASHYLVRLYLVSILEHAKAWLAEDRKKYGEDWASLIDPEKINSMTRT